MSYVTVMSENNQYLHIGERVDLIRQRFTDMNQTDWANYLGVTTGRYNNWKNGRRRIPLDVTLKLCQDFGLSLDWIYIGRPEYLSETAFRVLTSPSKKS